MNTPDPDDPESEPALTTTSSASIRELILGSWQLAIVVVDVSRRYRYANSHGKEILERGNVFKLRAGSLVCANPELDAELAERVTAAARKTGLGHEGIIGWSVGRGADPEDRVIVRFSALTSPKRSTPLIELHVARAEADFVPPQALVAHSLGLTRMQARVAVEIARGNATGKIAEQLGIRPDTVKDHLKCVYQRLHIDGARERGMDAKAILIRKIMALSY
ncbi:MAG TPA: LuxR C-terminal-related transcriptional regulator [Polyangiaceae bacterium]|nr:LuxR C-terminal-related transcriptional regulator [Polyangiaceae bacterium]